MQTYDSKYKYIREILFSSICICTYMYVYVYVCIYKSMFLPETLPCARNCNQAALESNMYCTSVGCAVCEYLFFFIVFAVAKKKESTSFRFIC